MLKPTSSVKNNSSVVDLLDALNPVELDEKLTTPKLKKELEASETIVDQAWEDLLSTNNPMQAQGDLIELEEINLLNVSLNTQTSIPENEELWMNRFNEANEELYGSVDPKEVISAAVRDFHEINACLPDSYAAQIYGNILEGSQNCSNSSYVFKVDNLENIRISLLESFPEIISVIEALDDGPYNPWQVRAAITAVVKLNAEVDPAWSEWTVTNTPDKTMLSVNPPHRSIDVPDDRGPVKTKSELLGLTLHEIGVHATRAVNGYKLNDKPLAIGLPAYIAFEEGLGVLFEYISTSILPDKIIDRYVDIALATGAINGYRLSRTELFNLGCSREQARAAARGHMIPNEKNLHKSVLSHVNRIFRGGNGQSILNKDGTVRNQAVFNKDLVYYKGLIKARDYVNQLTEDGVAPARIIAYLVSGKFDPTNPTHLKYLVENHGIRNV